MSSTYSSYKFELPGTGEQAGTWGLTTNNNIGTAIEQAIGGYASVAFTGLTKTLTLSNSNAAQDARALYLELTGSPGGAATLEVPAIQKTYIIKNATTGGYTVTAKVTGMTGVAIPNGKTMLVYNNGTDVVVANDNINNGLTLGTTVLSVNSASDALRVTQTGSGNALIVEDSTNPDSTPFVITSSGVGVVGYTASTPNSTATTSLFQVNGVATFQSTWWGADANAPIQYFLKSRSGIYGTQGLVLNTDNLGTIAFGGSDGTNFLLGANIRAIVQGTAALNSMPTRLVFSVTYDGQSSPTIALTVSPEGCVEIGDGTGGLNGGAVLRIIRQMTATPGGVSYGTYLSSEATAAATTQAIGYFSNFTTAAGAFTLPQLNHFMAGSTTPGAGSTITTIRGFLVASSMTTGTNNYGFVSQLASAANVWGFFASGTANNAFNGSTRFGNTAVPTATVDVAGNVAATTTILSSGPTSGIGYATGAGGTVTQATSRKTGVTLNKTTGAITLFSTTTTANTFDSFTVTNSAVVATDVVIVNFKSGATADSYSLAVTAVAAGSFRVQIHNIVAVAVAEAPVINFAIIKGVTA